MKKKYKKPKNAHGLCEAAVGIDPNSRQPRIIRCTKPAVWLYINDAGKSQIGATLCDDCCTKIEEQDNARREKENSGKTLGG